jgi:hypothetical protein
MADDTVDDRLTILERAQLLHDATLRRHGEMLDHHEEQIQTQQDLVATQAKLAETLDAIKDMLGRGNGH